MAPRKRLHLARKATWLAFGLVAISALASHAQSVSDVAVAEAAKVAQTVEAAGTVSKDYDQSAEAAWAYKKALSTLQTLTAHPAAHSQQTTFGAYSSQHPSIVSTFLPHFQGQGPFGSFVRVLLKIHQILPFSIGLEKEGSAPGTASSRRKDEETRSKAIKVIDLLQHSAELGHSDALFTLAQISLFPPTPYFPSDPSLAYQSYSTHASRTGNASSQALVAFFHATGYRSLVPVDQAKAQLYYTFAAHGGHKGAQQALAYRYWAGIGTVENCQRAMSWYESAAEQAMAKFLSGPPGGRTLPLTATKLSDLEGGIFGPGASVASTGFNAKRPAIQAGISLAAGETWENVLHYYLYKAEHGELEYTFKLAVMFYQGSLYTGAGGIGSGAEGVGAIPRDIVRARNYFLSIARQVWPRDPLGDSVPGTTNTPAKDENGPLLLAARSAGYIGRMYLRGEGFKQNHAMAKMWFERGAEHGDKESHNGLGIIWREGLVGDKKDLKRALNHFALAAGQSLAESQINLGKHYLEHGDLRMAATYFDAAIRDGSPFEAYYYMAQIQAEQSSQDKLAPTIASGSCAIAVSFFKVVSERGVWEEDLLKDAERAWLTETERGKEMAILKWWIAAERGSEVAQNNLAFVLDQDKSVLRLTRFSPIKSSNDTARLALTQWTRSAHQTNVDALVKVGDYYYHGIGVSEAEEDTRFERAARYYHSAADTQTSALAMWNLGWMYENGVGVPQDFHLAKRYYDLSLNTNPEAYLPVVLSLWKLYARSIWHTLMGGNDGLNLWSADNEESFFYQPKVAEDRELQSSVEDINEHDAPNAQRHVQEDDHDGPWYMGKAKEEFQKRRRSQGDEEDPIKWARDRRKAEADQDSDVGPEDYFDAALRGGQREGDEDEFVETMLLLGLVLAVTLLLYVRTRVVDRLRRLQQQQRAEGGNPQGNAQGDPGLFPAVGNPDREDWAILR